MNFAQNKIISQIPKTISPINAWLSYIKKLHNKSVDMSLERVNSIATRLNILPLGSFVFIVAGTNGKGTTCRTLEAILMASGYSVGVYNSPHLIRYTERVRIQNTELPDSAHINSFATIEDARCSTPLTYFEFSTLSALWLFKQAQLDVVILEVGLGGRLDATNIVNADVAIITNIALDHTEWLGTKRENIAFEKAGIFRTNKPAIIGETLDIPNTIIEVAQKQKTQLLRYGIEWNFIVTNKNNWSFQDNHGELSNLPLPNIPQINAATALAALRASKLKVNEQAICDGIRNSKLPGRFQIVKQSPRLILDVAHNPHAAAYLAKQLKTIHSRRILAVIGMLRDKDIAGTLIYMKNIVDRWYCAPLKCPRGASAEHLMKYIYNGEIYESITHAWKSAVNSAHPEDTVLAFGSFYTVAHVMRIIDKLQNNL